MTYIGPVFGQPLMSATQVPSAALGQATPVVLQSTEVLMEQWSTVSPETTVPICVSFQLP